MNCNGKISNKVSFGVSQNAKMNFAHFYFFPSPLCRLVEVERQSQNWKKQLD